MKAFLRHREERKRAAKQAAIEKKKNKRKAERARLKKAAKKEAKDNFVEFDEDAWYESVWNHRIVSTPSTRRLLDGVVMPVPHRSTEPGRPRHRREMTLCTRPTG